MSYRITRIVGVKDDIEVVKLSCDRKIKDSPQFYNRKLLEFYDRNGVRLDYIDLEWEEVLKGQKGGRKPVVSTKTLLAFMEKNPKMNQIDIAKHFGVSKQAISYKLNKIKNESSEQN